MGEYLKQHAEFFAEHTFYGYLLIVVLTLLPLLELRASIPVGILLLKMNAWTVLAIAIVTNILLGPVFYWLLDKCLALACRSEVINSFWQRRVVKLQNRIKPMVDKYGIWGLGLFIGVPLPGSGVYSGGMGGYVLGFTRKEFLYATILGVIIAGAAVQTVVLTGSQLSIFIKHIGT